MFVGLVPFKMQAGEAGLWSWWFVWRKKFEAKQTQFLSFSPSGCVISRAQTTNGLLKIEQPGERGKT